MPTKPSDVLETFDNPHPHRDYIIAIEIPEFTCLCPRTGQPDFATLFLQYVPDRHCVELKSLKLYIWSYRDEGAFHEDVSNQILNDLVSALKPRYMRLRARFNVRGGITTSVIVEHYKPGWTAPPPPPEWLLSWPDADISAGGVDRDTGAAETTSAPASSNAAGPTPALGGTDDAMTTAIPDDTVYVGIDLEITGCQAVAIDNEGAVLGRAEALIPAPLRNQEQVTQDPTQWWKAVSASLTTLFTAVKPDRVKAIAVDGTSGTVLLCDETGRPVTPALMYDDARALAQAQAIGKYAGPNCGAHEPTSSLAKLLWLQEKKMHSKARWLLHQADWVAGRLSGLWGQSDYNNCLKLGFDPEALQWPPWLADLGIDARLLPSVHSPGETLGCITAEAARVFGLKPDTRIVAGTTDGVAAFLAAGAQAPGQGVTFLRTSLSLKLVSDKPVFSPEYGVSSHRLGDCWLAGGRSNSGGGVLLQYFDTAQMQAMTSQLNPSRPLA